ncbi:MAG: hypothetical protein FWB76_01575 [Oscillospiraceae bacterium]|nr:hypothetical protein [Oscillospiraceae bacterium]
MNNSEITVTEFEEKVFKTEGVRIVIRATENEKVSDYPYKQKEAERNSVAEWFTRRLKPKLGELQVEVVNGKGDCVPWQTHMGTVRASYK